MRRHWKTALFFALIFAFSLTATVPVFANDEGGDIDLNYYERGKVARISLIKGDVQVKRKNVETWESGTANLPLVEGDKLVTGNDSKVEIQIGKNNFLRLDENSYVSLVTLRDEGTALSLPEGTLSLRLGRFDKSREYFEIDAPKTTIALEKEGLYRLDAPRGSNNDILQFSATGGGQAKIYTENASFSIRNGRSARIFLEGDNAGEYEMRAASSFFDNWDKWVDEREYQIEQRQRANQSRAYYDEDIYGADELSGYGEWVYTRKYGYVWRPYRTQTARYSNWTPYRYGHWRYLPYYGWTWISDEPWGWSTSYYGRWVYVDRGWVWLPRDYFGHRRWQPSLVVFSYYGGSTCWYPLPYYYGYSYYGGRRNIIINNTIINNTTIIVNQNQNPNQKVYESRERRPPIPLDYAGAVTKVDSGTFGTDSQGAKPVPLDFGEKVIQADPIGATGARIPMPPIAQNSDTKVRPDREIIGKNPPLREAEKELNQGKIGAMPRESGVKLDDKLERQQGTGNRQPIERKPVESNGTSGDNGDRKSTGVFDRSQRPPISQPRNEDNKGSGNENRDGAERPVRRPPVDAETPKTAPPVRRDDSETNQPERKPRSQPQSPPRTEERPRSEPPAQREERPRYDPPPQREEPRREEPRREEPRREEPRQEAPRREEPRREAPRQEAPRKEEPRKEAPPPPKADDGDRQKDG